MDDRELDIRLKFIEEKVISIESMLQQFIEEMANEEEEPEEVEEKKINNKKMKIKKREDVDEQYK